MAVAVYWPGLQGDFFFDDEPNILNSKALALTNLNAESIREVLASGISSPSGRPVAQLSFALNYYFSGFAPFPFKASNLAIHVCCGMLAFLLALRLLKAYHPLHSGDPGIPALLVTAAWLLHPIQLTPVLYVVQRMTSLSALFLFAALLSHVVGRERGGRAGLVYLLLAWSLFWPLSILSKETGVLFPLFVLAWELILRRSQLGRLDLFGRVFAVLIGLTLLAVAIYGVSPPGQWLWVGYNFRAFSMFERVLTEGRVLWTYLDLIFFPRFEAFGLYHDDIPLSTALFKPWTTLPAWMGLAGLAWLGWRIRIKAPLVSFGIAWFFIGHLLESTLLPLEIAYEHRNYVPFFGVLLAACAALTRMLAAGGRQRTVAITLVVGGLAYYVFLSAMRAHEFGDEFRRTQIETQHHPDSAHAHYDAGRALAMVESSTDPRSPLYFMAKSHFLKAGELDKTFKFGWLGLIYLQCKGGQKAEPSSVEELVRRLGATPLGPGDYSMMYTVKEMAIAGTLCLERTEIERLFVAAGNNPTASPAFRSMLHSWLADYLTLHARDLPSAMVELDLSLAISPDSASNRLKRAQLAFLLGENDNAHRMLVQLRDALLTSAERKTLEQLVGCLKNSNLSYVCHAR